jgi:hypothetical protein
MPSFCCIIEPGRRQIGGIYKYMLRLRLELSKLQQLYSLSWKLMNLQIQRGRAKRERGNKSRRGENDV